MAAVVVLVQTRLARHLVMAAQAAVATVAQRQVQTGPPTRAVAVADRKRHRAGLAVRVL
jgi:hypothetical protein